MYNWTTLANKINLNQTCTCVANVYLAWLSEFKILYVPQTRGYFCLILSFMFLTESSDTIQMTDEKEVCKQQ